MGEVIQWAPPTLPYAHVVCKCGSDAFHVETAEDENGSPVWCWLHCIECENAIPVDMSPVYGPEGGP